MLDENLPTFYIKPSASENPHSSTIYLSQNGSELQPEYTLRRPDPELPASHNRYGVALYDSYNPEVLFAEVLVEPEWTQPTLSQAEIRAQNAVPPPPVPVVPNNFIIQLYNPDQQVTVKQIPGSWNSSAYWEFQMPQNTFRVPSASALDRSQSDPAASDITPKITFKWRRDGKLSNNISCVLAGKTTDGRKNKEPDIMVAMFKSGKNLTIYQPNMHRVEVEDSKGLEVVLLLGATVIKDVFFNASREMFNIKSPATTTKRKNSSPTLAGNGRQNSFPPGPVMSGGILPTPPRQNGAPASQVTAQSNARPQQPSSRPPPANARTQWEIDAETARLKALVEAEEREREKIEREEQRRIKKMLEAEEKERKRRDAEVAKETERLRKQYGVTDTGPQVQFAPPTPPRPQQPQYFQQQQYAPVNPGISQSQTAPHSYPTPTPRPQSTPLAQPSSCPTNNPIFNSLFHRPQRQASPYLQAPGQGSATSSGFFGAGGRGDRLQKKRSVFF
ncbi:hypothetical protein BP6252_00753 [Coleophoma cylindrospora]|uniref:Uncharacterized protein n=1 Tax=Coleophoma cylindrospora TaxID=1849047 RepID=A0A3D8SRC2_9HELO|nr:hypothetical protein BP6252_00753 [Coleophoma cylindrospora]